MKAKVEVSLKQAWVLMHLSDPTDDEDLRGMLVPRAQLAVHFLGMAPVDNIDSADGTVSTMEHVTLQPVLYDREVPIALALQ